MQGVPICLEDEAISLSPDVQPMAMAALMVDWA
jgi:hypothetical protein